MSTTIEVKTSTVLILEDLMRRYDAQSLDDTIRILIEKAEQTPESLFGSHPDMKPFRAENEVRSHEP